MTDTPLQAALRAAFNSKLSLSATLDELPSDFLDEFYPAGEFVICAGTTLPPRTLLCNGAAVSRTTYSRLFTAIGTKYGSGDGSTTFNLPNVDGRVLQGTSDTSKVGSYLEAQLPNIIGKVRINEAFLTENRDAFYIEEQNYTNSGSTTEQRTSVGLVLDASTYSSVYSGTVLQPKALSALICIRF